MAELVKKEVPFDCLVFFHNYTHRRDPLHLLKEELTMTAQDIQMLMHRWT